MTDPYPTDPSAIVSRAMGGPEWFFDIEARYIHRVGLMKGVGFEFPPADRGINYCRIEITPGGGGVFDMIFGKRCRESNDLVIQEILKIERVLPSNLRAEFERVTITQED